jgi:hypothetical protein
MEAVPNIPGGDVRTNHLGTSTGQSIDGWAVRRRTQALGCFRQSAALLSFGQQLIFLSSFSSFKVMQSFPRTSSIFTRPLRLFCFITIPTTQYNRNIHKGKRRSFLLVISIVSLSGLNFLSISSRYQLYHSRSLEELFSQHSRLRYCFRILLLIFLIYMGLFLGFLVGTSPATQSILPGYQQTRLTTPKGLPIRHFGRAIAIEPANTSRAHSYSTPKRSNAKRKLFN